MACGLEKRNKPSHQPRCQIGNAYNTETWNTNFNHFCSRAERLHQKNREYREYEEAENTPYFYHDLSDFQCFLHSGKIFLSIKERIHCHKTRRHSFGRHKRNTLEFCIYAKSRISTSRKTYKYPVDKIITER